MNDEPQTPECPTTAAEVEALMNSTASVAVAAEREACAAIADRYAHSPEAVAIATKIRARK